MDTILSTAEFRSLEAILRILEQDKNNQIKVNKIKTFRSVLSDINTPLGDKQVARRKIKEYIVFYTYSGLYVAA